MTHRQPIVAGNWKMNLTRAEAVHAADLIARGSDTVTENVQVLLFPAFVHLDAVRSIPDSGHMGLGAQDVYFEPNGAFTGEISVEMLSDLSITHVLVGHSERRHVLGEDDQIVQQKARAAIAGGLRTVLCIGETIEQREAGETDAVNDRQLSTALEGLSEAQTHDLIVAYEPVWAIGTGKTATPEDAQSAHAFIRSRLGDLFGDKAAARTRILYGGSVKAANARELFSMPDIDGGLVGGASLDPAGFTEIIKHAAQIDAVAD